MYLMYIDESGDTIPLTQSGKKHLVLTGCIIAEQDYHPIEQKFREIKLKYYQNPVIEVKSNFLRYANPDISLNSPLKLHDRQKYNELENEITAFLQTIQSKIITVAINKQAYWQQYPSQNPYEIAYMFLLERFQKYLEYQKQLGICIIDPREGQVEKHFLGNELTELHDKMRWDNNGIWHQCPLVIEKLLFSQSDKTIGIQLADLYCYPIYHMFEYDKKPGEYWRYDEICQAKLLEYNTRTDGIGLKYFPEITKKGLRFYT